VILSKAVIWKISYLVEGSLNKGFLSIRSQIMIMPSESPETISFSDRFARQLT
jgi:hypothetical protein